MSELLLIYLFSVIIIYCGWMWLFMHVLEIDTDVVSYFIWVSFIIAGMPIVNILITISMLAAILVEEKMSES